MNDSRPVISAIRLAEPQMTNNELAKNEMVENEKGSGYIL